MQILYEVFVIHSKDLKAVEQLQNQSDLTNNELNQNPKAGEQLQNKSDLTNNESNQNPKAGEQLQNQSDFTNHEENIVRLTVTTLIPMPLKRQQQAEQRRARRFEKYQQIWELHRQGWSREVIAQKLGIGHSTVSVASNIAEGYGRQSRQEYIKFLYIALGSLRELDTQFIIASIGRFT